VPAVEKLATKPRKWWGAFDLLVASVALGLLVLCVGALVYLLGR
jgi:hypothetical protein